RRSAATTPTTTWAARSGSPASARRWRTPCWSCWRRSSLAPSRRRDRGCRRARRIGLLVPSSLWHDSRVMGGTAFSTESLLWPFNEQEKKYAPRELFVAGDKDLLRAGPCVAIVGSRDASPQGLGRARKLAALLTKH